MCVKNIHTCIKYTKNKRKNNEQQKINQKYLTNETGINVSIEQSQPFRNKRNM